jgi:hypothetical protein
MLFVELLLVAAGVGFLTRRYVVVGGRYLPRAHTIMVGVTLALTLPLALTAGCAIGAAEGVKASRDGMPLDEKRLQKEFLKKYWWLDGAVCGVMLFAAGALFAANLRPIPTEPPPRDDSNDAVGVRDFVAEREAQARSKQEREAVWRGHDLG